MMPLRDLRSRLSQGTVAGHVIQPVDSGWSVAAAPPGSTLADIDELDWIPAQVPGTVAGALRAGGLDEPSLDDRDWWFRVRFTGEPAGPDEEVVLCLEGIATVAQVHLNGRLVLDSTSMFEAHGVDVGGMLQGDDELVVHCRALTPLLAERRRPRARWRTRIAEQNLRFFRTSLLGRAPGFAPGPAPVGPWRPVRIERRRGLVLDRLLALPRVEGADGVLTVRADVRPVGGASVPAVVTAELSGPAGAVIRQELTAVPTDAGLAFEGTLRIPGVERWWPHTHGEPVLYDVGLRFDDEPVVTGRRVGFRQLDALPPGGSVEREGISLRVNDVPVFARGAVWTPADPVGLAAGEATTRAILERVRDGGMNMLRVCGLGAYEDAVFHGLCDELGILVWQDLMFANFDYPYEDPAFREQVDRELDAVLSDLAGRPSLAVVCGNSEVEQQAAMLGLDPAAGRPELFGEAVPSAVARAGLDAVHVPSSPCGGDLPFRPDEGVANYYGVGGYRRPLTDARRSAVRFAGECLAFSNVPDDDALEALLPERPGDLVVHHPAWKRGVPRDAGSGWDFEDVRDHYLQDVYGVDPAELRRIDHERYLELSRAVTGDVMAAVFGEWRRAASVTSGALVLWLRDLLPGAGWGVLDHRGEPKAAFHHLRRALAPVAVWMVDEGLGGVDVHVANDLPAPLEARLRVALYRDGETRVDEVREDVLIPAHGAWERGVESLLGRFVDASWAYRFGPPAQDVIVASLVDPGGALIGQAFAFPAGRPQGTRPVERTGLRAALGGTNERPQLTVGSTALAYGVRVTAAGFRPADDAFCVEPGGERTVVLEPRAPDSAFTGAAVTALNVAGTVRVAPESSP